VQIGQLGEFGQNHRSNLLRFRQQSGGNVHRNHYCNVSAPTLGAFKPQTKFFLNVGGFHLAPNMTIILTIHALHLSRMANWKMNG